MFPLWSNKFYLLILKRRPGEDWISIHVTPTSANLDVQILSALSRFYLRTYTCTSPTSTVNFGTLIYFSSSSLVRFHPPDPVDPGRS